MGEMYACAFVLITILKISLSDFYITRIMGDLQNSCFIWFKFKQRDPDGNLGGCV